MSEIILADESYRIIGACFEVYNTMGCGFLESVYHECLEIELADQRIPFQSKQELAIHYKSRPLRKKFEADFICFDQVVVEIKACSDLTDDHSSQLLNYLHATRFPLGILVNFGCHPKLQSKRIALTRQAS